MKVKKRGKKKKKANLAAEDISLLNKLVEESKLAEPDKITASIPNPHLAAILVSRLPLEQSYIPLVEAIANEFPQKEVNKSVRKYFFRLKSKGISAPEHQEAREESILKPIRQENPEAYMGVFDEAGNRSIFVAIPRIPRGYDLGVGVVHEYEGLLDFHHGIYSKKGLKEIKNQLLIDSEMPVVEIPFYYAASILERSYSISSEKGLNVSPDYMRFRNLLLEKADLKADHPVYSIAELHDIQSKTLTKELLDKLFENSLMTSFVLSHDNLKELLKDLKELDQSPIHLTKAQKSERAEELKEKWLLDNYPPEKRNTIKFRFEDSAYIFWKQDAIELARIALAAARELETDSSVVLLYLLNRTIEAGGHKNTENGEESSEPGSIIHTP